MMKMENRPLWTRPAPGALGERSEDIPSITAFPPPTGQANGGSLLILPGGRYAGLAAHEGEEYAEWFASLGFACYVLQYRLGSSGYRHPVMLQDAARALRLVRFLGRRNGLDPARIGIIGSSAGGHLAATLMTHFDSGDAEAEDIIERESSRPDLGILCYPVITMGEFTHEPSRQNLLGDQPDDELVGRLSAELQVTKETPPCFIWHTLEDQTVPVENSLLFAASLRRNRIPCELHIYEPGRHGLGLGGLDRVAPAWGEACVQWLRYRKFL